MEAELVSSVTDTVASSVSTSVRVAAFHDECLVIVLESADLFDFNAVLCSKSERNQLVLNSSSLARILTKNSRKLESLLSLDVLRDKSLALHDIALEEVGVLVVFLVLREREVLILEELRVSVGVRFDDDLAGCCCAEDCE